MKIYDVTDKEFIPYGTILDGYDTAELVEAMKKIPMPEEGTAAFNAIREVLASGIDESRIVYANYTSEE